MNKLSSLLVVLLTAIGLSACQTVEMQKVSKNIDQNTASTEKLVKKASEANNPYKEYTGLVENSSFYIGGRRVKIDPNATSLPDSFKKNFTLASDTALTLSDLAEQVTLMTGIPVRINPDAASTNYIKVKYSGPLSGFFDGVSARQGISWKYSGDTVILYRIDTKTWSIKALPGDTTLSATVTTSAASSSSNSGATGTVGSGSDTSSISTGSTGSSTSAGTGSQTATYNAQTKVWKEIEDSIKSMLTKDGRVVVSPGTNSITVTDSKSVLDNVDVYVREHNRQLSRQAVINVKAYTVKLNRDDVNGIDWSLVYQTAKGSLQLTSPFTPSVSGGSLTASLLNPRSQFNGTKAILDALEKQGKVALMTSSSVTTLNAQPVPVQVAKQTSYLASVSTTTTGVSGTTQVSLTPGTVTTGFSMNLLPAIFNDGRMLLQYAISISDLISLVPQGSGSQTIRVPEVDTRNFLQRVAMKSGQTLVLSGFERLNETWNSNTMFNTTAAGGGYSTNTSRDVVVIMITPTVIDDDDVN